MKGRDHLGDLCVDGRTVIKYTLKEEVEMMSLDSCASVWGPMASSYDHGYEPSICIKGGKFSDQLSDSQLLKEEPAPWS
jgi:hypothetical protein